MNASWLEFLAAQGAVVTDGHVSAFAGRDARADSGLAAAHAPTVTPLTRFAVLDFAGDDAQAFLHSQFSSDVRQVDATSAQLSSYSTAKGRMLASFLIWQRDGRYRLLLAADLASAIDRRLGMFILRSKVSHAPLAGQVLLGIAGEHAARRAGVIAPAPAADFSLTAFDGGEVIRLPGERFVVMVAEDRAADVWHALQEAGSQATGEAAWDWHDIATGTPWISLATQEAFVPQMTNMELLGAVNFKKGCYPGQEIVARTQYIGKVKRRMLRAHVDADASAGQDLYAAETGEQSIGKIVQSVPAAHGGSEVLAVAQLSAWASGVHLGAPDGPALTAGTLPYPVA